MGYDFGEARATYEFTNESLQAIVEGMQPKATDRIFAVAGSGDQALALLEFSKEVFIADFCTDQMELVKQRIDSIGAGEFGKFYVGPETVNFERGYGHPPRDLRVAQARNEYFSANLESIRGKLSCLHLLPIQDAITACEHVPRLDKIYLSNILTYGNKRMNVPESLARATINLAPEGLVYISKANLAHPCLPIPIEPLLPADLTVDRNLTKIAKHLERGSTWEADPVVLRKRA